MLLAANVVLLSRRNRGRPDTQAAARIAGAVSILIANIVPKRSAATPATDVHALLGSGLSPQIKAHSRLVPGDATNRQPDERDHTEQPNRHRLLAHQRQGVANGGAGDPHDSSIWPIHLDNEKDRARNRERANE